MTKKHPDKARPAGKDSREDRLKAALKANMARRKAQMRGRKNASGADEADKDEG